MSLSIISNTLAESYKQIKDDKWPYFTFKTNIFTGNLLSLEKFGPGNEALD